MRRPAALFIVIALLLVGCGGGEEVVEDPGPTLVDVPEVPTDADGDLVPFLAGVSDEIAQALDFCARGARDWCDFAGPQLSDAQLEEIADICGLGDADACSASANLAAQGFPVPGAPSSTPTPTPGPTSTPSATPTPAATTPPEVPVPTEDGGTGQALVELDSGGMFLSGEYYAFGSTIETLEAALRRVLGPPTSDTGTVPTDAGCPTNSPTYRFVEWGPLSLTVLETSPFADGVPHLAQWILFEGGGDEAVPLVFLGDGPGIAIRPGETTVQGLRDSFGDFVEVADEPPFGPQFTVGDEGGTLFGALAGLDPSDVVLSVLAGQGCGE